MRPCFHRMESKGAGAMVRKPIKLDRIEHNEPVTGDSHYEFLYQLQHALLLALREQGRLSPMHLRHAQEALRKQRRDRAKRKQEEP